MKKKLLSLFLSVALVLSLCPAVFAADDGVGELKQVYGLTKEEGLYDEDALVLLIMGDGFTATEQDTFYAKAKETANYIMGCAPYDEFADTIKIYALGVESNESGVTGANASSAADVANNQVDTYFGASFWSFGMDRLVSLTLEGEQKGYALRDEYLPETDYCLYIVNSTVYGGSGGDYCVASLNTQSYDMMVHEMGHTIGDLADEYYAAGYEGEYVNLTADPDNVPWERFIGKNGIGIYDWGGNPGTGYYIPSQNCKMQYLSNGETVYDLCEVCQEQMRKALCADSNVTKLFFQTYADEFVAGEVPDMRQYFILRRGSQEVTGDKLGDALTLTYYDADNKALPGVPQDVGTYTVKAEFAGNDQFGACTVTGTFDVVLVGISLRAYSKVEDGTPAKLDIEVKYDGDYIVDLYFEGTQSNYGTYVYTSYYDNWDDTYYVYRWVYSTNAGDYVIDEEYVTDSEPTEAADYAVTVTVYDEYGEDIIGEKTAYYTISTKCKTLLNNDSDYYYGATPYANNQNIIIYGEGFTLEEQDKFDALAKQLMDGIMATEPFKETKLYFDVVSVNTVSRESGIGPDGSPKDTFFRLTYDAKGKIIPSYDATYSASYLAYSFAGYQGATIVIVNDKNATGCDTYYSSSFDQGGYHLFSTVYVTPNDKNWTAYAAQEVLNHLTWHEAGYTADNWFKQAQQRLELLDYMYYEDTEYNACAPIIVSRAYDMTFVANGRPVDLEPYFQVYRGKEVLPGVDLNLTYYDAKGNVLEGAPSEPGTYSVLAETVPYDPDPSNPNESYWAYYMPAGYTDYEDALWLGMARGYTTFTILPSSGGVGGGSGATNDLPFADIGTNHVFHDYIQYVYEYGIMNGRTATYFDATSPLTRGQLAATLYRMAGSPDISDEILGYPFSDVDAESYYSNAIYWARLNGIVDGYEDGSFRPNAPVSRQAMMTILYRYAESLGLDVSVSSSNNLAKFQDGGQVSSVMTDAVNWAVEKGFVSGNTAGLLNPTGSTTRGAAAKILAGFHQDYIA